MKIEIVLSIDLDKDNLIALDPRYKNSLPDDLYQILLEKQQGAKIIESIQDAVEDKFKFKSMEIRQL
jgi:hypothetical protein